MNVYKALKRQISRVESRFPTNLNIFRIIGAPNMKVPFRKVEANMEFLSKKEMTEFVHKETEWWIRQFGVWRVTRKEFYETMQQMSKIAFNIHKVTGWRGSVGMNQCEGSGCNHGASRSD